MKSSQLKKLTMAVLTGVLVLSFTTGVNAAQVGNAKKNAKSEVTRHVYNSKAEPNVKDTGRRIYEPQVAIGEEVRHNYSKGKIKSGSTKTASVEDVFNSKRDNETVNKVTRIEILGAENVDVPKITSPNDASIIGTPMATQSQCVRYLLNHNPNPNLAVSAEEIVAYYYEEGTREGIRPDVAFAQALKETGFFRFGGDVVPEQNNYCGLATTGNGVRGTYFASPQLGVRAHIQHLLAYSSTRKPTTNVVDPRYDVVRKTYGTRTLSEWNDLNGRWAVPGYSYGQEILSMFNAILSQ